MMGKHLKKRDVRGRNDLLMEEELKIFNKEIDSSSLFSLAPFLLTIILSAVVLRTLLLIALLLSTLLFSTLFLSTLLLSIFLNTILRTFIIILLLPRFQKMSEFCSSSLWTDYNCDPAWEVKSLYPLLRCHGPTEKPAIPMKILKCGRVPCNKILEVGHRVSQVAQVKTAQPRSFFLPRKLFQHVGHRGEQRPIDVRTAGAFLVQVEFL